jgi:diguanylate cyclase (GGDEF)-like protein/PAS domain S-box-containing protein
VRARLVDAEETLRAIRSGEVDALVVHDASPDAQVFTLSSADRPYRMFVESMRDGAATLSDSGIVLYANRSLAELVAMPLAQLIGSPIASLIADDGADRLDAISGRDGGTSEVELITRAGARVPVRLNTSTLAVGDHEVLCVTFTDLTQQKAHSREIDRLRSERLHELERTQDALTKQATHDALTGLANRALLVDRITQSLALAERTRSSVALVFVDLDGFKEINDTRGHAAGDAVLRRIARRLEHVVRPMDSVCRLGGDEFVVLMPGLGSAQDAGAVATRIAADIGIPINLDHGAVAVTASIGISVVDPAVPGEKHSADRLLQQADMAMYHAKSRGGAKTELFVTGVTPTAFEINRGSWVVRIREALDEDRFVLYAQPIIDLTNGANVRHELLLRLRETDGQLIAPLQFLPTAERCGLIGAIDRWVVKQAAGIARTQPVAINLSATSAADPAVLDLISQQIRRHQIDPANIMVEITETALMQDVDRGQRFAERMVELGCSCALDDFGTGFASFTYLKRIPVQYLKIDLEFVRNIVDSERDRSIVSAITALAGGFGQATIAEGVEDEQTARVLRTLGVGLAQGYLFGRPAPLVPTLPS